MTYNKRLSYICATAALYFKVLLFWNDNCYFCVKIISIPDEELFSETYVWCTVHCLNYMMFPLVLYPPPSFKASYCYICGHRRLAVARFRMICLVLVLRHITYSSESGKICKSVLTLSKQSASGVFTYHTPVFNIHSFIVANGRDKPVTTCVKDF